MNFVNCNRNMVSNKIDLGLLQQQSFWPDGIQLCQSWHLSGQG